MNKQCYKGVFGLLLCSTTFSATVNVLPLRSTYMGGTVAVTVVFPAAYHDKPADRFPALYLLHGFGGDHRSWPRVVPLDSFADDFACLFVCPDAKNSWYVDGPLKKMPQFESFLTQELIPFIDTRFRTIAEGAGRAIAGSSMGGHGAITLLAKHADLFCGAGSISGIMDLTEFPHKWGLSMVFGGYPAHRSVWERSSALHYAAMLVGKNKTVRLECGSEDFALAGNRAMHARLNTLGVAHEYRESPGRHDERFVRQVAREHLYFLIERMKRYAK